MTIIIYYFMDNMRKGTYKHLNVFRLRVWISDSSIFAVFFILLPCLVLPTSNERNKLLHKMLIEIIIINLAGAIEVHRSSINSKI